MQLREWLCCMLLIGVKGHAGMSPSQNFGKGGGKLKRVPIKTKTTPPHGEKKYQKGLQKVEKSPPPPPPIRKRSKKAPT